MKCHEDNKGSHNHSTIKHMLHMVLCCGLPIIIIGALPLITRFSPGAGGILGRIAPFLCPIMMISMLPMMFGSNKKRSCCDNTNKNQDDAKSLEVQREATNDWTCKERKKGFRLLEYWDKRFVRGYSEENNYIQQ